jgi:hypothetical protein
VHHSTIGDHTSESPLLAISITTETDGVCHGSLNRVSVSICSPVAMTEETVYCIKVGSFALIGDLVLAEVGLHLSPAGGLMFVGR